MPLKSDKKLLEQWKKQRKISEGDLYEQHAEAANDHAFFAGDKMAYTATVTDKSSRFSVVFNKVKPYIDAVSGFMVQLRRKPQYLARIFDNAQQQELSEYLNSLSNYARENANIDQLESKQDKEMLITGYGAIDTNVVYEINPDGEVQAENVEYDDIWWDPQSREPNLLDSRWVFRRKKFDRDEATKRFRGTSEEDFETYKGSQTNFEYNPSGGLYDKIAIGEGQHEEDLVQVYYYQYWQLETYYRARNPIFEIDDPFLVSQLSQIMQVMREKRVEEGAKNEVEDYFEFDPLAEYLVMTPSIKSDMQTAFKAFGILDVEYQEHQKRVYYTAIITGEHILMKFRSPDQQGFTIKFKTGDYDHENERWFGMVASLKEPARYANKSLTEILYVIASNSKGGVMYEESAVEDPARFEQQWATTRSAIKLNDGAISGNRIAPKAQSSLPSGYENIYAVSNDSLGEVTGISKEFLGNSQASQVSGLLEQQRINQTKSTLASYFDSITLYQKEHARLMITLLRILADNSEGRLIKVVGRDGSIRFQELLNERFAEEYDVDIEEAPSSPAQREQLTGTMIQLADKLALMGQNIYPIVVQYLPIKAADKQKLVEALTPKPPTPEQTQQQQATQQLLLQGQMANIQKDKNDALLKQAQAQKIGLESDKTAAETDKTLAETDNTRADTLKTLAEGEQKSIENDVIKQQSINNIDLVI